MHQRDHDRDKARTSTDASAEMTRPGRTSASASLRGPEQPLPSGIVMRKANGVSHDDHSDAIATAAASTGDGLPADLRERFESSLGTDLQAVRIHTGAASARASQAVDAKAYTVGNDIHFGPGEYDPSSAAGQHLLAHEVAHTVQQRGGSPTRQNKLAVSQPGDHLEMEADRAADAMIAGRPAMVTTATAPTIARTPQDGSGPSIGASVKSGLETLGNQVDEALDLPPPVEWNGLTAGLGGAVVGAWSDAPAFISSPVLFHPRYFAGANRFRADWSHAQASWNAVVPMKADLESRIAEASRVSTISLGEVHQPGAAVRIGEATGNDDGPSATMQKDLSRAYDPTRVPPKLKQELATMKVDIENARSGAANAAREVQQGLLAVDNAKDAAKNAALGLTIAKNEQDIEGWKQDIQELESYKTRVKGILSFTGSALKGNLADTVSGTGSLSDALFDAEIQQYRAVIGQALAVNASVRVEQAIIAVRQKLRDVESSLLALDNKNAAYKAAVRAWDKAHIGFSTKAQEATLKTTNDPQLAARIQSAIQALPLIEDVCWRLHEGILYAIDLPGYSEASGLGAAVCSNTASFVQHVGALSGYRTHVRAEIVLWEDTRDHLQAFVKRLG